VALQGEPELGQKGAAYAPNLLEGSGITAKLEKRETVGKVMGRKFAVCGERTSLRSPHPI